MHLSGPIPFTFEGLEQGIGNKRLPKRESGKPWAIVSYFHTDACIVQCVLTFASCTVHQLLKIISNIFYKTTVLTVFKFHMEHQMT